MGIATLPFACKGQTNLSLATVPTPGAEPLNEVCRRRILVGPYSRAEIVFKHGLPSGGATAGVRVEYTFLDVINWLVLIDDQTGTNSVVDFAEVDMPEELMGEEREILTRLLIWSTNSSAINVNFAHVNFK